MRYLPLVLAVVLLGGGTARAEGGPFGLGLVVGEPTGITGELKLTEHTALDGAVGISLFDDRDFYFHLEFLYFLPELIHGSSVSLSAYLGIGGYMVAHRETNVGARVPFGLSLEFTAVPLEIFLEVAFKLRFIPEVDPDVGGALGFRYYF